MSDWKSRRELDTGVIVATIPLDFGGTSRDVDAALRAEATAIAGMAGNDDSPVDNRTARTLARSFDAERYVIRHYVPQQEGRGYWDIYRVSAELFVLIGNFEYFEPKWLGSPGEQCLKIRYLRSGKLIRSDGERFLNGREAMYEFYPSQAGDGYFVSPNTPCQLVTIQCANSTLTSELALNREQQTMPLRLLSDEKRTKPYARDFQPTTAMANSFTDLIDKPDLFESSLRCWFVEAKSKEIIASLLQLMLQQPNLKVGTNKISRRDRQRIIEAREIINAHIANVPTIPELARMVGINQTKLKAAHKEMFGSTIRKYVADRQMKAAARMLTYTNFDVSQIGQSLGYRHAGNFSQAFKRYFGRVPREYRRQMAVTKQDDIRGQE